MHSAKWAVIGLSISIANCTTTTLVSDNSVGGTSSSGGFSAVGSGPSSGGSGQKSTPASGGALSAGGGTLSSGGGALNTGGTTSGGASIATAGANTLGGTSAGGASSGGTSAKGTGGSTVSASVSVASGPWGSTATDESVGTVSIPRTEPNTYLLVAAVANSTQDVSTVTITDVSMGSFKLTHLAGGTIAGTAFCSDFWGARVTQALPAGELSVSVSTPANVGILVWSLAGVNPSNAVGEVLNQGQATVSTYQENFPNKTSGSMLFGAFFDGSYATGDSGFLPIAALEGSVVEQTRAGYYAFSKSSATSGPQSIGANLPEEWSIYRSAIEILP